MRIQQSQPNYQHPNFKGKIFAYDAVLPKESRAIVSTAIDYLAEKGAIFRIHNIGDTEYLGVKEAHVPRINWLFEVINLKGAKEVNDNQIIPGKGFVTVLLKKTFPDLFNQ